MKTQTDRIFSTLSMNIFTKSLRSIVGCALLCSSVLTAFSLPSLAGSRSLSIGNIKNSDRFGIVDDYCKLHLTNDRQKNDVFFSASRKAVMNINGKDTILTLLHKTPNKRGSIDTYRAGDLRVKVNFIQTRSASPANGDATYNATIAVNRGNRSKVLTTKGVCGFYQSANPESSLAQVAALSLDRVRSK